MLNYNKNLDFGSIFDALLNPKTDYNLEECRNAIKEDTDVMAGIRTSACIAAIASVLVENNLMTESSYKELISQFEEKLIDKAAQKSLDEIKLAIGSDIS